MSIDLDRRYVGKINPDDTRTLWRIDTHGGAAVPPIAWAGDGQPDWGSAHDPVSYTHLTLPTNREV